MHLEFVTNRLEQNNQKATEYEHFLRRLLVLALYGRFPSTTSTTRLRAGQYEHLPPSNWQRAIQVDGGREEPQEYFPGGFSDHSILLGLAAPVDHEGDWIAAPPLISDSR